MTEAEFGRYLLRELLWELAQFDTAITDLTDVPPEQIEVLSFSSYHHVRLRTASVVIDAELSWKGNVPPRIAEVTDDTVKPSGEK